MQRNATRRGGWIKENNRKGLILGDFGTFEVFDFNRI